MPRILSPPLGGIKGGACAIDPVKLLFSQIKTENSHVPPVAEHRIVSE
jgi:hypothetical protein